jgi:hypothetical protein
LLAEVPIPPPRSDRVIDPLLTDYELFMNMMSPEPDVDQLGDLWADVVALLVCLAMLFTAVCFSTCRCARMPFVHGVCQPFTDAVAVCYPQFEFDCSSQADMPAVLGYLAGCKNVKPPGQWAWLLRVCLHRAWRYCAAFMFVMICCCFRCCFGLCCTFWYYSASCGSVRG